MGESARDGDAGSNGLGSELVMLTALVHEGVPRKRVPRGRGAERDHVMVSDSAMVNGGRESPPFLLGGE